MRTTYETRPFDFTVTTAQQPRRVILHRQDNPGAKALAALEWGKRTDSFSIHSYIGDKVCYDAVSPFRHAFHVLESRVAQEKGWRVYGPYGYRGDYDSIGVECEDVLGGAPGQAYSLTQETRITLLLRVAAYIKAHNLTPENVWEHADLDPYARKDDLGDALNILDFRLDLHDYLAGRTPWRTVGKYARGTRAVAAPAPAPSTDSPPFSITRFAWAYARQLVKTHPLSPVNGKHRWIVEIPENAKE
jgi:N-acetylmuramoyl-L-alanine amidase CwlA